MDDYGIRLCDTGAYSAFPDLAVMPANTVVCMRRKPEGGSFFASEKKVNKTYEASRAFFEDFFGYDD